MRHTERSEGKDMSPQAARAKAKETKDTGIASQVEPAITNKPEATPTAKASKIPEQTEAVNLTDATLPDLGAPRNTSLRIYDAVDRLVGVYAAKNRLTKQGIVNEALIDYLVKKGELKRT